MVKGSFILLLFIGSFILFIVLFTAVGSWAVLLPAVEIIEIIETIIISTAVEIIEMTAV